MKSFFLPVLLFACLCVCPAHAQLRRVPFAQPPLHQSHPQAAARTQAKPLVLPFFEDFSTYAYPSTPDTALWVSGQGATISNTIAEGKPSKGKPYEGYPSKGVAVLDGIAASGSPYKNASTIIQDSTDRLTSRPINLSGKTNVGMSFWWGTQGLGETPDLRDSLVLEFRARMPDGTFKWQRVWSALGSDTERIALKRQTIPATAINRPEYLHADFQFRFKAYGRPTGQYDVWLIDYIMMDENFAAKTAELTDYAVTKPLQSLLKRYSAMPWEQFKDHRLKEWAGFDSLPVFVQKTIVPQDASINFGYEYIIQQIGGEKIYELVVDSSKSLGPGSTLPIEPSFPYFNIAYSKRIDFSDPIFPASIPVNLNAIKGQLPIYLRSTFTLKRLTQATLPQQAINTTFPFRNDTISRTTVLDNYYAYDDGTAEDAVGVRQKLGQIATRYILNKPDTLTNIDIAFSFTGEGLPAGQTFILTVWKRLDGQKSSVLYERSFPVQYGRRDTSGKQTHLFFRYPPEGDTRPLRLLVSDTLYVGWRQTTNDLIAVGYDTNTPSLAEQFYDISGQGQWQPATLDDVAGRPGSILIRPVFANVPRPDPNATEDEHLRTHLRLYPNPTTGTLYWNQPGIRRIEVCDLLGRVLSAHKLPAQAQHLNLSALPNGLYLIRLHTTNTTITRKLMLAR